MDLIIWVILHGRGLNSYYFGKINQLVIIYRKGKIKVKIEIKRKRKRKRKIKGKGKGKVEAKRKIAIKG